MTDNSRVRVSIVGVVVVALFSTLVARLWFMQSGAENSLKNQAVVESTRVLQTESPRGEILDRNGKVLVKDKASWAVTVDRNLSKATATRVLGQLAELLHQPEHDLRVQYESLRQSPLQPAVVAINLTLPQRLAILQDPQDYPGVQVTELTVRTYPQGVLAAQVLGYVGSIPAAKLKELEARGYEPTDQIGVAGAEAVFERMLRGRPRRETIEVDPAGKQVGSPVSIDPGSVGNNVWLSLDVNVQRAAETSLAQGIAGARGLKNTNVTDHYETLKAPGGAVVVENALDGSIEALASNPTYDPSAFVGGLSSGDFAFLNNAASNYPLLDRATEGLYAPGSTFKLVTSLAMTQAGIMSVSDYFDDKGFADLYGTKVSNAQHEVFNEVNLQQALTVSSDAYFATVGSDLWTIWHNGDKKTGLDIQQQARELGFGAPTGIQLDESPFSRVPDPDWKSAYAHANYKTAEQKRENSIWEPADNFFLAIGQGDLVVTPLQLANAYAAFDNGSTLWQPSILDKVENPQGKVIQTSQPKAIRHVSFDPTTRAAMMAGFQGAVAQSNPAGTAYQAFQGFPFTQVPVAGKTGTAQVKNKGDTSLFVGMFTANGTPYVIAVVVEQGGFGAQVAAPIARRVIEAMNGLPAPPVQVIDTGQHD